MLYTLNILEEQESPLPMIMGLCLLFKSLPFAYVLKLFATFFRAQHLLKINF